MANICPCTLGNSVAGALFNMRNAKKLNQELPEQTGTGTVLSRRVDTVYSLTKSDSSWGYFVKFQLECGEVELKVTEEDYRRVPEGHSFQITWKGDSLTAWEEAAE